MHLAQTGDLASLIGCVMDIADFDIAHLMLLMVHLDGNYIDSSRQLQLFCNAGLEQRATHSY